MKLLIRILQTPLILLAGILYAIIAGFIFAAELITRPLHKSLRSMAGDIL